MQQVDSTKERARLAWKTRVPLSVRRRLLFELQLVGQSCSQLGQWLFKVRQPVALFSDFLVHFPAQDTADIGVENLLIIGSLPCYVPLLDCAFVIRFLPWLCPSCPMDHLAVFLICKGFFAVLERWFIRIVRHQPVPFGINVVDMPLAYHVDGTFFLRHDTRRI